jgi:hypothetical protein
MGASTEDGNAIAMAMLRATKLSRRDSNELPGELNVARPPAGAMLTGNNPYNVMKARDASTDRSAYAYVRDLRWLLK